MRNYFIVGLLLIVFGPIKAQEKGSRIQFGMVASLDHAYRTLHNTGNITDEKYDWLTDEIIFDIIENRNELENFLPGYNVGCRVVVNLSKRISLESGPDFSRRGFSYTAQILSLNDQKESSGESPFKINNNKLRLNHNYYYLSMPVLSNFALGNKKLKFIVSFGGSFDVLLQKKDVARKSFKGEKDVFSSVETANYNTFNFTSIIAAGISADVKESLHFRIQPIFRYGVIDVIDAPITPHLWSIGLNCGMYYQL